MTKFSPNAYLSTQKTQKTQSFEFFESIVVRFQKILRCCNGG
jgi:hypothetical protein